MCTADFKDRLSSQLVTVRKFVKTCTHPNFTVVLCCCNFSTLDGVSHHFMGFQCCRVDAIDRARSTRLIATRFSQVGRLATTPDAVAPLSFEKQEGSFPVKSAEKGRTLARNRRISEYPAEYWNPKKWGSLLSMHLCGANYRQSRRTGKHTNMHCRYGK